MEILKRRYPEIGFYLSFTPFKKVKLPNDSTKLEKWLSSHSLDEVDILYIVGLIGFPIPNKIIQWLKGKKERALIFVEESLGAFASLNTPELIENPQIHLHFAKEDPIEILSEMFPSDRLEIFEGKAFDSLRLKRRSAAISAIYSDLLYSHKIVKNVLTNFSRLSYCFHSKEKFQNIPAIICGAGPSLDKALSDLKKLEDKALIFAGGSTIAALTKNGIQPHFGMALDPNEEEFFRLKQSTYFEGPFLFAPRLHHHVFSTVNGPFGYLKTDTGGLVEHCLENHLKIEGEPIGTEMGSEAFSVTTLALSYAQQLGCNPIVLLGVDLAYHSGRRYAKGVEAESLQKADPRALEKVLTRKDLYGNKVKTLLKWVMEADCISAFAQNHPETDFLNATEGGLGFKGIKNLSLEKIFQNTLSRDLSGEVHQWCNTSNWAFDHEKYLDFIRDLTQSLDQCEKLTLQILGELEKKKETGRLVLYKSELVEEIAYGSLLDGINGALDHLLNRYYPHVDPKEGKWEKEIAKYQEIRRQISQFKQILETLSKPALLS